MRLAFDATALFGHRTGVGHFAEQILRRLVLRPDLDIVVYATTWRRRHELIRVTPKGVTLAESAIPARLLRRVWTVADRPRIERFTGPIEVSYGPNFLSPPAEGAQEFVTVHDLTPILHPDLCTPDTLQYPALLRRAVRRGAIVHTPTRAVADEVESELSASPDRVIVIPNGVTPVGHGVVPARLAARIGCRYLLAVGTIEPRKGLDLLVAAFDQLAAKDPELTLVLAGPDGWGTAQLNESLGAARHRDRVVRTGAIDEGTKSALLRGALALVYPSRYEGFGQPPLEAMSVGTPVVATDIEALVETTQGGAELVRADDVQALVKGIGTVTGDADRRAQLVARGYEVAAGYDWDDSADRLAAEFLRFAEH